MDIPSNFVAVVELRVGKDHKLVPIITLDGVRGEWCADNDIGEYAITLPSGADHYRIDFADDGDAERFAARWLAV
ncbi:hypothetical protein NTCA1_53600 [Novosphingobium sp. TCA1]|nr:hypothetical protein NTCA1_53600 [Novosphingobium sp. TCA1]